MSSNQIIYNQIRDFNLVGEKKYTYADYLSWNDGQRYELIDGIVYNVSPVSSSRRQQILGALHNQFYNYLSDKEYEVYLSPLDVCLFSDGEDSIHDIMTVVQPDLFVICDQARLDERGYKGVPDLIIDIILPRSNSRYYQIKRDLYENYYVKEYWIVDYNENMVKVYLLNEDKQYGNPNMYNTQDILPVSVFDNFNIDLNVLFEPYDNAKMDKNPS